MWNTIKAIGALILSAIGGAMMLLLHQKKEAQSKPPPPESKPSPTPTYTTLTKDEVSKILDKEPKYEENITLDPLATTLYGEPREPELP